MKKWMAIDCCAKCNHHGSKTVQDVDDRYTVPFCELTKNTMFLTEVYEEFPDFCPLKTVEEKDA